MAALIVDELLTMLGFRVNTAGLQQANQALGGVSRQIEGMVNRAAQLAVTFFGVQAAASKLMESIKLSGEMESITMQFKTMLGDLDSAKYLVQEIQKRAIVTPYTTMELASQVRLMMAFGQSANQAMHSLQLIGDVAGADRERLHRLGYALGQVTSATYLKGDDLRQFIEAGFNPLTELSKESGKSMMQLRKEMEQGKISAQQVTHAFEMATGPGGKFFNHMQEQSLTMFGLWSTIRDRFQILLTSIGDAMQQYIKDTITALTPLLDAMQEATNQLVLFFQVLLKDGPSAQDTAYGIATAFMTVVDAIMAVGSGLMFMWTVMQVVAMGVTQAVGAIIDAILFIPKVLGKVAYGISYVVSKIPGVDKSLYAADMAALEQFQGTGFGEYYSKATNDIGNKELISGSWNKFLQMSSMIGGSAPNPTTPTKLTDKILANLQGKTQVINNNINNSVTVNAEGGFKDLLKEGANSVFSLTFGEKFATRLVAATV